MPGTRPTDADSVERWIWEKEVDEYMKRKTYLRKNIKRSYTLVHEQCSSALITKVEGTSNCTIFYNTMDVVRLLAAVRGCIFEFDDKKKKALVIYRAEEKFLISSKLEK
eukprot:4738384-Ditylum_brightwellii.AAC.1